MQTQEAIKQRRSVRSFQDKPISRGLIEKIVDAGRLAPTARNIQPWEFIAVTQKEILKKLGQIADTGSFISQCSACIVVCSEDTKYYLEDGCAATENILIAATDLGLASCWVAGDKKPYAEKVKELLGIPKEFKLVSLIALGYADLPKETPSKRTLKEVLHWQRF